MSLPTTKTWKESVRCTERFVVSFSAVPSHQLSMVQGTFLIIKHNDDCYVMVVRFLLGALWGITRESFKGENFCKKTTTTNLCASLKINTLVYETILAAEDKHTNFPENKMQAPLFCSLHHAMNKEVTTIALFSFTTIAKPANTQFGNCYCIFTDQFGIEIESVANKNWVREGIYEINQVFVAWEAT